MTDESQDLNRYQPELPEHEKLPQWSASGRTRQECGDVVRWLGELYPALRGIKGLVEKSNVLRLQDTDILALAAVMESTEVEYRLQRPSVEGDTAHVPTELDLPLTEVRHLHSLLQQKVSEAHRDAVSEALAAPHPEWESHGLAEAARNCLGKSLYQALRTHESAMTANLPRIENIESFIEAPYAHLKDAIPAPHQGRAWAPKLMPRGMLIQGMWDEAMQTLGDMAKTEAQRKAVEQFAQTAYINFAYAVLEEMKQSASFSTGYAAQQYHAGKSVARAGQMPHWPGEDGTLLQTAKVTFRKMLADGQVMKQSAFPSPLEISSSRKDHDMTNLPRYKEFSTALFGAMEAALLDRTQEAPLISREAMLGQMWDRAMEAWRAQVAGDERQEHKRAQIDEIATKHKADFIGGVLQVVVARGGGVKR